jgi:dTDP-4-amino-4,6-dideoxygalactose transaminase
MEQNNSDPLDVPFFRPSITDAEVREVVACLQSGWLTTGPRTRLFETRFAGAVGAKYSVAVNSCTAALHLAVEALNLRPGQAVLVPTMTFAATAEVVRYQGAAPLLVDCDPITLNMDLADAERKIADLRSGKTPLDPKSPVVGIMPVHVGGLMMDVRAVADFASRHNLWIVEDAAHAFPAAYRQGPSQPWQQCGQNTAAVTCFSFYANKTITTGEGGMAVTDDQSLAERMKQMSLHGLSRDAWNRFSGTNPWDYRIIAPGFKYNLTDIAAAVGGQQLDRAESMRADREKIARFYLQALGDLDELELPPNPPDRVHAWHLFPLRLRLDRIPLDRNAFIEKLHEERIGCSVHWRPLHLHPYYEQTYAWKPEHLPAASTVWQRLVSLPLFPGMTDSECEQVARAVRKLTGSN